MKDNNYFTPNSNIDADLQKELDEALGDMSIDDILKQEEKPEAAAPKSEIRKGKVISINKDDIFVDIGGRHDGLMNSDQFRDEPLPEIGDEIEVVVDGFDSTNGLIRLSRQGAVQAAAWDNLHKGLIVEGRVTGHNKGGLELDLGGKIRAFMPISQIDLSRIEEDMLKSYLEQKLECEVSEVDRANENIIVSRKALLLKKQEEMAGELWETIHEGKIVTGKVRSIMPYGAFVDIGGIDGLLHIKDMAHARVEKPEDIVQVGQELELKIVSIDKEAKRIGLGLKQTLSDPWDSVETNYPVDSIVTGKVVKLMDFGAFVELEAGLEALIPIGEITFERRINHPKEVLTQGDMVKVRVLRIDTEAKRMSLSLKRVGDDPWMGASARWSEGSIVEGPVTRIVDFGAFVQIAPAVEGLVHISQMSTKRIASPHEAVREGQVVQAKILEVDEAKRRISLSIKQLTDDANASEAVAQQGTMEDLEKVNEAKPKKKKNLKGGLEGGHVKTAFGDLKLG